MKNCKKNIALALAILLLLTLLSGCGKKEDPFQVVFGAPFPNEERAAAYGETLTLESETPVLYRGFTFGSEDVDPMAYAAGAMKMTAMVAAGELDILVCDLDDAARYARSGCFYPLEDLFTQEELAEYSDRLLSFEVLDELGEPTGERMAPCGIDVSGRDDITRILGETSYGIFIVAGTADLDTAKEIFWKIVNS